MPMMETMSSSKPAENYWLWLIKIFTGLLIVAILLIHLIINHLISESGLLTHAEVVSYYKKWFVPFMEITFLITAITHSLIGVRSIIIDLNPTRKILSMVTWIFIVIGSGFIIYGIWLVKQIMAFS